MAVYLLPLPQRTSSLRAGAVAGKIGITCVPIAAVGLAHPWHCHRRVFGDLKERRAVSQGAAAVEVGCTRAIKENG